MKAARTILPIGADPHLHELVLRVEHGYSDSGEGDFPRVMLTLFANGIVLSGYPVPEQVYFEGLGGDVEAVWKQSCELEEEALVAHGNASLAELRAGMQRKLGCPPVLHFLAKTVQVGTTTIRSDGDGILLRYRMDRIDGFFHSIAERRGGGAESQDAAPTTT